MIHMKQVLSSVALIIYYTKLCSCFFFTRIISAIHSLQLREFMLQFDTCFKTSKEILLRTLRIVLRIFARTSTLYRQPYLQLNL
jgi:hypothetical protein